MGGLKGKFDGDCGADDNPAQLQRLLREELDLMEASLLAEERDLKSALHFYGHSPMAAI
jgi:hypothetical protein